MKRQGGQGVRGAGLEAGIYRMAAAAVLLYHRAVLAMGLADEATRSRYRERLGIWANFDRSEAKTGTGPVIWMHAASVGEVVVATVLVAGLRRTCPTARILLTCNTATGREAAASVGADELRYFPVDHPRVVSSVVDMVGPALFIFVETEIWPTLLTELEKRGVPTAMVNARISERSYPRYRLARALLGRVLAGVDLFCVRDRDSFERLAGLGAPSSRTHLTGELKFDVFAGGGLAATTEDLLGPLMAGQPAVVAASTREGEEELVLEAFSCVLATGRALRLVLAPRHAERSGEVARLAAQLGLSVLLWTQAREAHPADRSAWEVLVVDSVGELRGFMKSALGVFVGGTLVPVGGHNLLEPAAFALPVAAGPYLANVAYQAGPLRDNQALASVEDAEALSRVWLDWLDRPEAAQAAGQRALEVVERGRGALARTLAALEPYLPR